MRTMCSVAPIKFTLTPTVPLSNTAATAVDCRDCAPSCSVANRAPTRPSCADGWIRLMCKRPAAHDRSRCTFNSRAEGALPSGLNIGQIDSRVLQVSIGFLHFGHGRGSTHLRLLSTSLTHLSQVEHLQSYCGQETRAIILFNCTSPSSFSSSESELQFLRSLCPSESSSSLQTGDTRL